MRSGFMLETVGGFLFAIGAIRIVVGGFLTL